jgi:hypothetical protein
VNLLDAPTSSVVIQRPPTKWLSGGERPRKNAQTLEKTRLDDWDVGYSSGSGVSWVVMKVGGWYNFPRHDMDYHRYLGNSTCYNLDR